MKKLIKNVINKFGVDIVRMQEPTKIYANSYDKFPQESLENQRFYNIGAGFFHHPYWTNVDYSTPHYESMQSHPFVQYDLMELVPLPIESDCAEVVYSSHTIEHVSDEAVANMLKEAYRILKPGGYIRLTTPDITLNYNAYKTDDRTFWTWIDRHSQVGTWENLFLRPLSEASNAQIFLHQIASQLCEIDIDDSPPKKFTDAEIAEVFSSRSLEDGMNYFSKQCKYNPEHPGNHVSWWTEKKLISFLNEAGFTDCYKSGYGQSLCPPLRDISLFDNTYPAISLYIEATK